MRLSIPSFAFAILLLQLNSCRQTATKNYKIDFTYVSNIDEQIALQKVYKVDYISDNIRKLSKERTYATILYDLLGREVVSYLTPPYTNTVHRFYNNQGLPEQILDSSNRKKQYFATYLFDSSKRLLTQCWSGDAKDTCLFYFNELGQLIRSFICTDIGNGAFRYYKTFFYRKGKLVRINSLQIESLQDTIDKSSNNRNTVVQDFFYTSTELDSTIERFVYKDGDFFSKTETYKPNGLAIQCVNTDGNRVKYKYYYR